MTSVWFATLLLTGMISTSNSWPNIDLPDDMSDRITDHLPDLPTPRPEPFKNLSISIRCDTALSRMFSDQRSQEDTLALDAIGKPQPGFLIGNLDWLGHWPECKRLETSHFCTAHLTLNLTSMTEMTSPGSMLWGLCLPFECGEDDVANSITEIIDKLKYFELKASNPKVTDVICATTPPRPFDVGFYATVVLCCVVALLMVAGAFYEVYLRQKKQREESRNDSDGYGSSYHEQQRTGRWGRLLICFSFTRNLSQLLNTETKGGSFLCLNGIRVISMTWIILGHLLSTMAIHAWDGVYAREHQKYFLNQALRNFAFPSVDSFFLLSGFLVTYNSLGRMTRSGGRLSLPKFYFHRYWRLLPAYGAAILFATNLMPYFDEGPAWGAYDFHCNQYWWANLLYINNFYPIEALTACIAWTWYLADDMQFYVLSPIILLALFRKPVVGIIIISALCVASFATTFGLIILVDDYFGDGYFSLVYVKPYCRITPYLVGMVLGYCFLSWKGKTIRINKIVVIVGWATATAIGLAVVYGRCGEDNRNPMSRAEHATFRAFAHFAWPIALSWVVFACHYGYGGWISDFLSWKAWIPLSRLTYGAYLFHMILLSIFDMNRANDFSMNAVYIAYYFASTCVFSFLVSLLVSLGFELPMANIESMILK